MPEIMMEQRSYGPYFDPDFETLVERIYSPRVCIDNHTCEECTLVKVDSANRHGILLEMVQVLTDLDLVISKSYISSDGGWLMDVFHVTDRLGNKLTDGGLIRFIQQSLHADRRGRSGAGEVRTCLGKLVGPAHLVSEYTSLEMTATDRPGLLSEISAVLAKLGCRIVSVHAWTHNSRAACIMYLTDESSGKPISDLNLLACIEEQVEGVTGAHGGAGERRLVRLLGPTAGRIHTERRLHQLMREDQDYEAGPAPQPVDDGDQLTFSSIEARRLRRDGWTAMETQVSVESWKERGYSVVSVTSKDRPKLLFDTVCELTDMQYVVFHAAVSSHGPLAIQEYYIRHKDGCTLDSEAERRRVARCLAAAVERRVSHGLKVDVCTGDRPGLLSVIMRVLRENGMSLARAECTTRGTKAVGTFYVTDASSQREVNPGRLEAVRNDIGSSVTLEVNSSQSCPPINKVNAPLPTRGSSSVVQEDRPSSSLGSLLWSHIRRFSSNFGSIRS